MENFEGNLASQLLPFLDGPAALALGATSRTWHKRVQAGWVEGGEPAVAAKRGFFLTSRAHTLRHVSWVPRPDGIAVEPSGVDDDDQPRLSAHSVPQNEGVAAAPVAGGDVLVQWSGMTKQGVLQNDLYFLDATCMTSAVCAALRRAASIKAAAAVDSVRRSDAAASLSSSAPPSASAVAGAGAGSSLTTVPQAALRSDLWTPPQDSLDSITAVDLTDEAAAIIAATGASPARAHGQLSWDIRWLAAAHQEPWVRVREDSRDRMPQSAVDERDVRGVVDARIHGRHSAASVGLTMPTAWVAAAAADDVAAQSYHGHEAAAAATAATASGTASGASPVPASASAGGISLATSLLRPLRGFASSVTVAGGRRPADASAPAPGEAPFMAAGMSPTVQSAAAALQQHGRALHRALLRYGALQAQQTGAGAGAGAGIGAMSADATLPGASVGGLGRYPVDNSQPQYVHGGLLAWETGTDAPSAHEVIVELARRLDESQGRACGASSSSEAAASAAGALRAAAESAVEAARAAAARSVGSGEAYSAEDEGMSMGYRYGQGRRIAAPADEEAHPHKERAQLFATQEMQLSAHLAALGIRSAQSLARGTASAQGLRGSDSAALNLGTAVVPGNGLLPVGGRSGAPQRDAVTDVLVDLGNVVLSRRRPRPLQNQGATSGADAKGTAERPSSAVEGTAGSTAAGSAFADDAAAGTRGRSRGRARGRGTSGSRSVPAAAGASASPARPAADAADEASAAAAGASSDSAFQSGSEGQHANAQLPAGLRITSARQACLLWPFSMRLAAQAAHCGLGGASSAVAAAERAGGAGIEAGERGSAGIAAAAGEEAAPTSAGAGARMAIAAPALTLPPGPAFGSSELLRYTAAAEAEMGRPPRCGSLRIIHTSDAPPASELLHALRRCPPLLSETMIVVGGARSAGARNITGDIALLQMNFITQAVRARSVRDGRMQGRLQRIFGSRLPAALQAPTAAAAAADGGRTMEVDSSSSAAACAVDGDEDSNGSAGNNGSADSELGAAGRELLGAAASTSGYASDEGVPAAPVGMYSWFKTSKGASSGICSATAGSDARAVLASVHASSRARTKFSKAHSPAKTAAALAAGISSGGFHDVDSQRYLAVEFLLDTRDRIVDSCTQQERPASADDLDDTSTAAGLHGSARQLQQALGLSIAMMDGWSSADSDTAPSSQGPAKGSELMRACCNGLRALSNTAVASALEAGRGMPAASLAAPTGKRRPAKGTVAAPRADPAAAASVTRAEVDAVAAAEADAADDVRRLLQRALAVIDGALRHILDEEADADWTLERVLVPQWIPVTLRGPGRVKPRCAHTASWAGCRGAILIAGGVGTDQEPMWALQALDPQTWTVNEAVTTTGVEPCARQGHSATVIGSRMFILGGAADGKSPSLHTGRCGGIALQVVPFCRSLSCLPYHNASLLCLSTTPICSGAGTFCQPQPARSARSARV